MTVITVPTREELEIAAARESARNLVKAVAGVKSLHNFQEQVWLTYRYPHRIEIDFLENLKGDWSTSSPFLRNFTWNFGSFRSRDYWHAAHDGTKVIVMFRNEDDKMLFRIGVMR